MSILCTHNSVYSLILLRWSVKHIVSYEMYIIVQDYQEKTVKHMTWNKYVIQWYDMKQSSGSAKATDPNTDRITPQKHEHVLPNTNRHRKDDQRQKSQ